MQESIEAILYISKEDRHLKNNSNLLNAIPEKKKKLRLPLLRVENQLDKLKEEEEQIRGQIQERETLVSVEKEKIVKSDEKMLQVKNQKEYIASQKEIDVAKKTIKKVEDQILEFEEKNEAVAEELSQVLDKYENEKETAIAAEEKVLEEEKKIMSKIDAYEKMKEKLLPKVDPEIFTIYESLTKRNIIPAAIEISASNCMGCALSIPAQLFNDIIRESIGKCPHCGRLLFYKAPEKLEEVSGKKQTTKSKRKTQTKSRKKTGNAAKKQG